MNVCTIPECQTSAGCKCRPPSRAGTSLSDWSDEDITREYHQRMLRKLGDPRIGVSFAGLPDHLRPANRTR